MSGAAGHECYHCKQWVAKGEPHDCWTTTEAALTKDLPEDLLDAWERLRETAVEFGDQRIYASHHSIMFSRKVCYFFVRPKPKYLEICFFLPRVVQSPRIRRVDQSSKVKRAHIVRVIHRDEVEAPLTDWLREAYDCAAPDASFSSRSEIRPEPGRRTSSAKSLPPGAGKKQVANQTRAAKRKGTAKKKGAAMRPPRGKAQGGR